MSRKRWAWVGLGLVLLLVAGAAVSALGRSSGPGDAESRGGGASRTADVPVTATAGLTGREAREAAADERAQPSGASGTGAPDGPEALGGLGSPAEPTRVIKTATLSIGVRRGRLDDAYSSVLGTVQGAGGFVAASVQGRGRAQLTLRIPAARFESTIADLRRLGKVTGESEQGEDVTATYVDIDARLRNWRAQEAILLDLMRQARTIPDTIAVQQQLSGIRQQIEELEGQRRLLDDQSGFGTLTLRLAVAGAPARGPAERSTLADAWEDAVGVALGVLGGTLVVLAALVPLALLVALLGLPARWIWRRARPEHGSQGPAMAG